MSKTVPFKQPAPAAASADAWISAAPQTRKSAEPTKRLTVDIPEPLHRRMKIDCAERDVQISDVVRDLLAKAFPAA